MLYSFPFALALAALFAETIEHFFEQKIILRLFGTNILSQMGHLTSAILHHPFRYNLGLVLKVFVDEDHRGGGFTLHQPVVGIHFPLRHQLALLTSRLRSVLHSSSSSMKSKISICPGMVSYSIHQLKRSYSSIPSSHVS